MARNNATRSAGRSVVSVTRRAAARWVGEREGDTALLNGPVIVRRVGEPDRVEGYGTALDRKRHARGRHRKIVLERDLYHCRYCQSEVTNETANMDHVRPWKYGGRTHPSNLVTCCRHCNWLKGNKSGRKWQPKTLETHKRLIGY